MPDQTERRGHQALLSRKLKDTSGAAIALVALSMVALLSAVALAVDGGMLLTTRAEAQRAADAGAIAGAQILAIQPDDSVGAAQAALSFGNQNIVRQSAADVRPEDITVDLEASRVYVNVRRVSDRSNAIPTFFARIFGVSTVNVTAHAAAEAVPAGLDSGAECLLPIMLPDRWSEEPAPSVVGPTVDDSYDPPGSDNPGSQDTTADWYDVNLTGYNSADIGDRVELRKASGGGGGINPSWYFPWTPLDAEDQLVDDGPGASTYEARFTDCLEGEYLPGDSILTEPGAMVGPTADGFDALATADGFDVEWNENAGSEGCPVKSTDRTTCFYGTKRIRPLPMFDPGQAPSSGRKVVYITQFAQIFYEGKQGNTHVGRWMGYITPDPGGEDSEGEEGEVEDIPKIVRLVL